MLVLVASILYGSILGLLFLPLLISLKKLNQAIKDHKKVKREMRELVNSD